MQLSYNSVMSEFLSLHFHIISGHGQKISHAQSACIFYNTLAPILAS